MANGTLLISGNSSFHPLNSLAENLNLRSCNMIRGTTDRCPLSRLDSVMKNFSERSRPTRKNIFVSEESMEMGRSSDDQLPVMRMFQRFVTSTGKLVECTHRGCKPVFEEEDSNFQVPYDWPSFENTMSDIMGKEYAAFGVKFGVGVFAEKGSEVIFEQTDEEVEAVEVVGMYASFLWATEEDHDE